MEGQQSITERQRLEALLSYNILDTPPEPEFDDLTALAAEICDTPMAMISLLDGSRQWFKSRTGTDVEETSQNISFCKHVVNSGELTVIPDTSLDSRTSDSPLVTDEGKRFYAGAPLTTSEGATMGALCVVDTMPRQLSDFQLRALATLSHQVMAQMDLRRHLEERKVFEQRLREQSELLDKAHDAIVVRDLNHRIIFWNQGAERLYGWTANEAVGKTVTDLLREEAGAFQIAYEATLSEGEWFGEMSQTTKDGRTIISEGRWTLVRDDNDQPRSIFAIKTDITERKAAEEVVRENQTLVQMASRISRVGAWRIDLVGREVRLAEESRQVFGVEGKESLGFEEFISFFEARSRSGIRSDIERCLNEGVPFDAEHGFRRGAGQDSWARIVGQAVYDQMGGIVGVEGAVQDISDRIAAEFSLATSKERFRLLAEAMPMIVWTTNTEGTLDYANHYFWDYTGISPDVSQEVLRHQILHPGDVDSTVEHWQHSVQTGEPFDHEYRMKSANGEYRWFSVQMRAVRDVAGSEVATWYGTAIDIHETKELQEVASRLAQRLITTLESITDGFLTMDHEWRFTYINGEAERLLMRPREELLGGVAWDLFPEAVGSSFDINYRKAVATGESVSFEEYFGPVDKWFDLHAYPSSEGIAVHFRDVSERKLATKLLDEQASLLSNAQRIGRMGSWEYNFETKLFAWPEATCALFGVKPEEFDGTLKGFLSMVVEEDREHLEAAILDSRSEGRPHEQEYRVLGQGGEVWWMLERGTVELDESGNPSRRIGMVMDITERHQAALALQRANAELEHRVDLRTAELARLNTEFREAKEAADAANLAKSEFLSRMSHELRTPMNAILGFGQLLQMEELDDEARDSLSHIMKAGQHLLVLINDVLEISRVEIGESGISLEPVNVIEVLNECHALVRPIASERSVSIVIESSGAVHANADRHKLRQSILNIVSNGVKYNRFGGTLTIRAEQNSEEVTISFTDTGEGIAAENVAKLFTPFERLGAGGAVEGTGLGLALTKSLMEAMGGQITATSTLGQGSCFTLHLKPSAESVAGVELEGGSIYEPVKSWTGTARVLVVEDNLTNIVLLERMFAPRYGFDLIVAMQGSIGLELAVEHVPHVILLDLHLPDMNGLDVLNAIKSDSRIAHIPVIMVSADAYLKRVDALLEAGAFRYVTKPFNLSDLKSAVTEALREGVGDESRADSS